MKLLKIAATLSFVVSISGCLVPPPPPPPPPPHPRPVVYVPPPVPAIPPHVIVVAAPPPLVAPIKTPMQRLAELPLPAPAYTPFDGRPQLRSHYINGYQTGWAWFVAGNPPGSLPLPPPGMAGPPASRQAWEKGAAQGRDAAQARLAEFAPPMTVAPVPASASSVTRIPVPATSATTAPASHP